MTTLSSNPKFILAGNGSYQNRGCEAIIRGTTQIIRRAFVDPRFIITDFGKILTTNEIDRVEGIEHHTINISRYSLTWFVQNSLRMLRFQRTWFPQLGKQLRGATAVLAVGGDNYSMDYGSLRLHLALLDYVVDHGVPFIIWGASVGPFDKRGQAYEAYVARKLQRATAIFAREDVTVEYLSSIGVQNNVYRMADPAFVMAPQEPSGLPFAIPPNSIGFNFSPLMSRYITNGDVTAAVDRVSQTLQKLATEINRPIILIPHVQVMNGDDYAFLTTVHAKLGQTSTPVHLLPPTLSSAEVKWVISQLDCFAGARMHATIAAFSSAVPTLSFSYSIKSIGLNQDLFGHQNYLLQPHEFESERVVQQIKLILSQKEAIQAQLQTRLPAIQEHAYQAGTHLQELIGSSA